MVIKLGDFLQQQSLYNFSVPIFVNKKMCCYLFGIVFSFEMNEVSNYKQGCGVITQGESNKESRIISLTSKFIKTFQPTSKLIFLLSFNYTYLYIYEFPDQKGFNIGSFDYSNNFCSKYLNKIAWLLVKF